MSKLVINATIVPADISEANLKNFDTQAARAEIDSTYKKIKAAAFAKAPEKADPSISVIFGSTGTGVRTLMQKSPGIICNAEDFAKELPSFQEEIIQSQEYGGGEGLRHFLQEATMRFLPAGRYMQDRLMTEAWEAKRDVTLTKRGRTSGGIELLQAITRVEASLHTIIYQAPLDVKLKGFEASYKKDHTIALTQEEVAQEHLTLTGNMQKMTDAAQGRLSIYFRTAGDKKGSQTLVASSQNGNYIVTDEAREQAFNETFAAQNITIATLMSQRKRNLAL